MIDGFFLRNIVEAIIEAKGFHPPDELPLSLMQVEEIVWQEQRYMVRISSGEMSICADCLQVVQALVRSYSIEDFWTKVTDNKQKKQ